MDVPPATARIESAAIVRRRGGIGGIVLAMAGLLLYIALGCALIRLALPHHDGALYLVSGTLAGVAWLLAARLAPVLALAAAGFGVWSRIAHARAGVIAVDDAGLSLSFDGGAATERVDLEDVLAGDHDPASAELALRLTSGAIHASGVAQIEADALLSAIAAGATDRALDLTLQRRATALRVATAIVTIPLIGAAIGVASIADSTAVVVATSAALALAWAWLTARYGSPTRLLVGHDGLALHGGGPTRFIPWTRLAGASISSEGIAIELEDQTQIPVRLLAGTDRLQSGLARRRRDSLVERIQREIARQREAAIDPLGASHLDRGDRSLAEWRAALRDLVTRPTGGYRRNALDPDHLASVLWSRGLAPERRLGAALALAATNDPAARQRVRVFIDTCADEALRDAVARAAAGELDDAELEDALARIERA